MSVRYFATFILLFFTINRGDGRKCWTCGYREEEGGEMTALPDLKLCGDFTTPGDDTGECPDENECCASMKETITVIDEETGDNKTVVLGRHACESALEHLGEFDAVCSEHKNTCYNVDESTLGTHTEENVTVTDVEVCFCDQDFCNSKDPIIEEPTNGGETTPAGGPTKTCYACGYIGIWKEGDLGEITAIDGIPFCKDDPSLDSFTKQCGNGDDCCGSVKEYTIRVVDGKEEKTMIARHDCESDLKGVIVNQAVLCNKNDYACFNVSKDNMAHQEATFAEACFCEGDRCNAHDMPDFTVTDPPTEPTQGGGPTNQPTTPSGASYILSFSIFTLLVSLFLVDNVIS